MGTRQGPNYEEKFREFFEGVEEARHPKNLTIFRGPGGRETWAPIKSNDFMGLAKNTLSAFRDKVWSIAVRRQPCPRFVTITSYKYSR